MVPQNITDYLDRNGCPYDVHRHARAVSAQRLAHALHVTGYKLAKTVVIEADGRVYLAVLPALELVDPERLAEILGARAARLLAEYEFSDLFPGCETGAEPPFGKLFGLPVVMDESLRDEDHLFVRAGSHEEVVEMKSADFERLEQPIAGAFAILPQRGRPAAEHAPAP